MKKHYRKENNCANCGAELQGKFCHTCGQENLELKENFGHMMTHAISDYFHFDHQFFHTIRPLFLKPGKLTMEYMAGRRVQYLHPVKMYIFISLVYFLLLFKSSHKEEKTNNNKDKQHAKKDLVTANNNLDSALKSEDVPSFVKPMIARQKRQNEDALKSKNKKDATEDFDFDDDKTIKRKGKLPGTSNDSNYVAYLANQAKLPSGKRDNFLMKAYNEKSYIYQEKYGEKAREAFYEDFKHNIPKMMFLLLPLCALIFKIAFWKNKKYYVEHLIFTFHLHCFVFAFLAIIMLLQMITPNAWGLDNWLDFIGFLGITWYLYRSLRVFYQRSRWRTVSKIFGAGTMYLFTFTFCITIVLAITALL